MIIDIEPLFITSDFSLFEHIAQCSVHKYYVLSLFPIINGASKSSEFCLIRFPNCILCSS